jgi:hypothetical protein
MASSDIDLRAEERAVILQAANLIARSARSRAQWSKEIRNAISISEVTEWQSGLGIYIKVDLSTAPMARAFEYGSGRHATRSEQSPRQEGAMGYIEITPKNAKALSFPGTHEWEGQTIVTQLVHHPGVAPRPYLAPAVSENRQRILDILRPAVKTSISRTIRNAWYHSG